MGKGRGKSLGWINLLAPPGIGTTTVLPPLVQLLPLLFLPFLCFLPCCLQLASNCDRRDSGEGGEGKGRRKRGQKDPQVEGRKRTLPHPVIGGGEAALPISLRLAIRYFGRDDIHQLYGVCTADTVKKLVSSEKKVVFIVYRIFADTKFDSISCPIQLFWLLFLPARPASRTVHAPE